MRGTQDSAGAQPERSKCSLERMKRKASEPKASVDAPLTLSAVFKARKAVSAAAPKLENPGHLQLLFSC